MHILDENYSESDSDNLYVGSINDNKTEISDYECFVSMDVNGNKVNLKLIQELSVILLQRKCSKKLRHLLQCLKSQHRILPAIRGIVLRFWGKLS